MPISGLDHVAFPTDDAERLVAFYAALGFTPQGVDEWRAGKAATFSIACGDQKISVHPETLVPLRANPAYLRGPARRRGAATSA